MVVTKSRTKKVHSERIAKECEKRNKRIEVAQREVKPIPELLKEAAELINLKERTVEPLYTPLKERGYYYAWQLTYAEEYVWEHVLNKPPQLSDAIKAILSNTEKEFYVQYPEYERLASHRKSLRQVQPSVFSTHHTLPAKASFVHRVMNDGVTDIGLSVFHALRIKHKLAPGLSLARSAQQHAVESWTRIKLIMVNLILVGCGCAMIWIYLFLSSTIPSAIGVLVAIIGTVVILNSAFSLYGAERVVRDVLAETSGKSFAEAALDKDEDTNPEFVDGLETVGQRILEGSFYIHLFEVLFLISLTVSLKLPTVFADVGNHQTEVAIVAMSGFTTFLIVLSMYYSVLVVSLYEIIQSLSEIIACLLTLLSGGMATLAVWLLNRSFELHTKVETIPVIVPTLIFVCSLWIMILSLYSFVASWVESRRMIYIACAALVSNVIPILFGTTVYLLMNNVSQIIRENCAVIVASIDAPFWDALSCTKYQGRGEFFNYTSARYSQVSGPGENVVCSGSSENKGRISYLWESNPQTRPDGSLVDYWGCINLDCCETLASEVSIFDSLLMGTFVGAIFTVISLLGTMIFLYNNTPVNVRLKSLKHHMSSKLQYLELTVVLLTAVATVVFSYGNLRANIVGNYEQIVNQNGSLDPTCDAPGLDVSTNTELVLNDCSEFVLNLCFSDDHPSCCQNGKQDGEESGIDCGCTCSKLGGRKCPIGQTCQSSCDCLSGCCGKSGKCQETCATSHDPLETCTNGIRDGDETCLDGGGSLCRNVTCWSDNNSSVNFTSSTFVRSLDDSNCPTNSTTELFVPPSNCTQHGYLCGVGQGCLNNFDCMLGLKCSTVDWTCFSPANGVQDGDETGVDCGGSSGISCTDGTTCGTHRDCSFGSWCQLRIVDEIASLLTLQNQAESEVFTNDTSRSNTTTITPLKQVGICASHTDGRVNGDETDVDCGGSDTSRVQEVLMSGQIGDVQLWRRAPRCSDGQSCIGNSDCASRHCHHGVCVSYFNKIRDGDETGTDCGGGSSFRCPVGATCTSRSDCSSGFCTDPVCRTSYTNGPLGERGKPCVFPATVNGEQYDGCIDGVSELQPFAWTAFGGEVSVVVSNTTIDPEEQKQYWCVTESHYKSSGSTTQLSWGYCVCSSNASKTPSPTTPMIEEETNHNNNSTLVPVNSTCYAVPQNQKCQLPFVMNDKLYTKCPTIQEAKPAGFDAVSFLSDESKANSNEITWCPVRGVEYYNADRPGSETNWGICSCLEEDTTNAHAGANVCAPIPFQRDLCSDGIKSSDTAIETDIDCGGRCTLLGNACGIGQQCIENSDCESGICEESNHICVSCSDGNKNGDETGIDCGGSFCTPCVAGNTCVSNSDCSSWSCDLRVGRCTSCSNGYLDGAETDVDCGGPACSLRGKRCGLGQRCHTSFDCQSSMCDSLSGTCMGRFDQIRNGFESGIDCGGGGTLAKPCFNGETCNSPDDCVSERCENSKCVSQPLETLPNSCRNGQLDVLETCVDGGGMCRKWGRLCPDGVLVGVLNERDCESGYVEDGVCVSCFNGILDGKETGVDCGGPTCAPCQTGQPCKVKFDCTTRECSEGSCTSCSDGHQNGSESDVDCGTTCEPCDSGKRCNKHSDCASHLCLEGTCSSCFNGIQDGTETGIDCGGDNCAQRCDIGEPCNNHNDCVSKRCDSVAGTCRALVAGAELACVAFNEVQDGSETDVDCGGDCSLFGNACAIGQTCLLDGDCASGMCHTATNRCVSCFDGVRNGDESDVDCGGGRCNACEALSTCNNDSDCVGGRCDPEVQQCISCTDGVQNGDETDIDCGGTRCDPCTECNKCVDNKDCESRLCESCSCRPTSLVYFPNDEGNLPVATGSPTTSIVSTATLQVPDSNHNCIAIGNSLSLSQSTTSPNSPCGHDDPQGCEVVVTLEIPVGSELLLPIDETWKSTHVEYNSKKYQLEGALKVVEQLLSTLQYCTSSCEPYSGDFVHVYVNVTSSHCKLWSFAGKLKETQLLQRHLGIQAQVQNTVLLQGDVLLRTCCSTSDVLVQQQVGVVRAEASGSVGTQSCTWDVSNRIQNGKFKINLPVSSEAATGVSVQLTASLFLSTGLASGSYTTKMLQSNSVNVPQMVVHQHGCVCEPETPAPSNSPTLVPTESPTTPLPTNSPINGPTASPTIFPSNSPSNSPTISPTNSPSLSPSESPSLSPTQTPSMSPTLSPTVSPTVSPSMSPSTSPTLFPTHNPTVSPTVSPTSSPTQTPSESPTLSPSSSPSEAPTASPTVSPSLSPTSSPSTSPSTSPTHAPTLSPTSSPTNSPSVDPTRAPTLSPNSIPSSSPSLSPTSNPTTSPTASPSASPTLSPTSSPTVSPSESPSSPPSAAPSLSPSTTPTLSPTGQPTESPSTPPSSSPTQQPTQSPTKSPSSAPSEEPTLSPTTSPSQTPTSSPSNQPTTSPTFSPSNAPSISPTYAPTRSPEISNDVLVSISILQNKCGSRMQQRAWEVAGLFRVIHGRVDYDDESALWDTQTLVCEDSFEPGSSAHEPCVLQVGSEFTVWVSDNATNGTVFDTVSAVVSCEQSSQFEKSCRCVSQGYNCLAGIHDGNVDIQMFVARIPDQHELLFCLSWEGSRNDSPQDLDLYAKFFASVDSTPCTVSVVRPSCGDANFVDLSVVPPEAAAGSVMRNVSEVSYTEAIQVEVLYKTKFTLFVKNYMEDYATETSGAIVSIHGLGYRSSKQMPAALDSWRSSAISYPGSHVPPSMYSEVPTEPFSGSFRSQSRYARVACLDFSGSTLLAAWSLKYYDFEPVAMIKCPETPDCTHLINIPSASEMTTRVDYPEAVFVSEGFKLPDYRLVIRPNLRTQERMTTEEAIGKTVPVKQTSIVERSEQSCDWANGIVWTSLSQAQLDNSLLATATSMDHQTARETDGFSCFYPNSFSEAQASCDSFILAGTAAVGSSVCTVTQLSAVEIRDPSCSNDGERHWTSTTCWLNATATNGIQEGRITQSAFPACARPDCNPEYHGERCWHSGSKRKSCYESWYHEGIIGTDGVFVNTMLHCGSCQQDEDCKLFVFLGTWGIDKPLYNFFDSCVREGHNMTHCHSESSIPTSKLSGFCLNGGKCGGNDLGKSFGTVSDGSCFDFELQLGYPNSWINPSRCVCGNYDENDGSIPVEYNHSTARNDAVTNTYFLNHGAATPQCTLINDSERTKLSHRCCSTCDSTWRTRILTLPRVESQPEDYEEYISHMEVEVSLPPRSGYLTSRTMELELSDFVGILQYDTTTKQFTHPMTDADDKCGGSELIGTPIPIESATLTLNPLLVKLPRSPGTYAACIMRVSGSVQGCTSFPVCSVGNEGVHYDIKSCKSFQLKCPIGWTGVDCKECDRNDQDGDGSLDCDDQCPFDATKNSGDDIASCPCGVADSKWSNVHDLDDNGISACNDCNVEECMPAGQVPTRGYRGCVSTTKSGNTCQRWTHTFPQYHELMTARTNHGLCSAGPTERFPNAGSKGSACVFPFTFNNVKYDSCVTSGPLTYPGSSGWCITDPSRAGDVITDPTDEGASPCEICDDQQSKWPILWGGLGDHNYCRNPDNSPGGAWCFVESNDDENDKRWEYCDIPTCDESNAPEQSEHAGEPAIVWVDLNVLFSLDLNLNRVSLVASESLGQSGFGALGTLVGPTGVTSLTSSIKVTAADTIDYPPSYVYYGCFVATNDEEMTPFVPAGLRQRLDSLTPSKCASLCVDYKYFGIYDASECICGNEVGSSSVGHWGSTELDTSRPSGTDGVDTEVNCVTNGLGMDSRIGEPCSFPFTLAGRVYYTCFGTSYGGEGVCFTRSGSWGGCKCSLPKVCQIRCKDTKEPCGGLNGSSAFSLYKQLTSPSTIAYVPEPLVGRVQGFLLESANSQGYEGEQDSNADTTLLSQGGSFVTVLWQPPSGSESDLTIEEVNNGILRYTYGTPESIAASPPGAVRLVGGGEVAEDVVLAVFDSSLERILLVDKHQVLQQIIPLRLESGAMSPTGLGKISIAFDPTSEPRRIYVAIPNWNQVRVYQSESAYSWRIDLADPASCWTIGNDQIGGPCDEVPFPCGSTNLMFCSPVHIAVSTATISAGHLFVVDQGNGRVQEFNKQGSFINMIGASRLSNPSYVRVSSYQDRSGRVYVVENQEYLLEFTPGGDLLRISPPAIAVVGNEDDFVEGSLPSTQVAITSVNAIDLVHPCSVPSYCNLRGKCLVSGQCSCFHPYFGSRCGEKKTSIAFIPGFPL